MVQLTLSVVLLCVAVSTGALRIQTRSRYDKIDFPGCGNRPVLPDNGISESVSPQGLSRVARVVGGAESTPYSWPSLCSLRTKYPDGTHGDHMCGANLIKNLIGDYFLITAAHCTVNNLAESYVAYCGIFDRSSSDTSNRFIVEMSHLYIHTDYDDWKLNNDVAIFKLDTQPPTNNFIQPICLPNELYNTGENGIVAGWGSYSTGGSLSYTLHQVNKPIKPLSVCRERYGQTSMTNRMFCAGLPEGGADFCKGDEGGGFFTYRFDRWTLAGIVSWGTGCGEMGKPGVYAHVAELKDWINIVINHSGVPPADNE